MDNKRTALTRTIIEGAQPQGKPYRLWDLRVPGLFMRVQPSGAKTWNVQWSRASSKSLGRHPVMTIDAARRQALAVLGDAAIHGTPEVARKRSKDVSLRTFLTDEYLPWAHGQHKAAEGSCRRIQNAFPDLLAKPLRHVTGFLIEKARTKRLEMGLRPSTCNRDFAALRSVMSKAVSWGFLDENPFKTVKVAKVDDVGVVRFLEAAEEKRLRAALAKRDADMRAARRSGNIWRAERGRQLMSQIEEEAFGDHLSPLVLVAMNTGLRSVELTSLTWKDVDLTARRIAVRAGYAKSGKARYVPLNSEAVGVLESWKRSVGQEALVFNVTDPKKAWAGLLEAAGIENFRFHDLRHHFASRLVMAGVDLNTVRELLGHADLKMTLRYAHLAPEHKAEAVERLISPLSQKKQVPAHEVRAQGQH